jgi:hypothetical protein
MAGAYTWHTLSRACVRLGLVTPPFSFTLGPSHAHPFPRPPFFHTGPVKCPFYFTLFPQRVTGKSPGSVGFGASSPIALSSPLFTLSPPLLTGPFTRPPFFTTPFLQPGPAIAQTLSHRRVYGCMSPPRCPFPIFTDYMRLCMGDTSPPWTHT